MNLFCNMYSKKHGKTYCGQTSNLIARFKDHNQLGSKGWARQFRPWEVIYVEFFNSRREASEREKYLKTGAGRDYIKGLAGNIL